LAVEQGRQVLVTTHSPLFCDAVLKLRREREDGDMGLFLVRRRNERSEIQPFATSGPLFQDQEVRRALAAETEDGLFESLMLRGLLDE